MNTDTNILPISINDLKDKYYDGLSLTQEEMKALHNFDLYRINRLKKAKEGISFKQTYIKIQAMANLSDYHYFLDTNLPIAQ